MNTQPDKTNRPVKPFVFKELGAMVGLCPFILAGICLLNLWVFLPQEIYAETKPTKILYVSKLGSDDWSGTLDVPSPAGNDGPLRTLEGAKQAIRVLKKRDGLQQAIEVVVLAGAYGERETYYLEKPLLLEPEDSGSETFPIIYRAEEKGRVILSGGKPIQGWQRLEEWGDLKELAGVESLQALEGDVWVADLSTVADEIERYQLLRVGNQWGVRARHPNYNPENPHTQGMLIAEDGGHLKESQNGPASFICFEQGTIPPITDLSDTEVNVRPGEGWFNFIAPVREIDFGKGRLIHAKGSYMKTEAGNPFFITGSLELMDETGEWCFDSRRAKLFYLAGDAEFPTDTSPVVAANLDRLIELRGDLENGRYVEHVHINDFIFTDTDYQPRGNAFEKSDAAIWLSAARFCEVRGNEFRWLGGHALRLENDASDNKFNNNDLHDLGQGGVTMIGTEETQPYNNEIAGNVMERLGLIFIHVGGVYIRSGSNNRIINNTITDIPRYGIGIMSFKHGEDEIGWSRSNIVERNDIRRSNQGTPDSGAIMVYSGHKDVAQQDTVIRQNLVRDFVGIRRDRQGNVLTEGTKTFSIFLSGFSSHMTVEDNIVVVGEGPDRIGYSDGVRDNVITKNIFVFGEEPPQNLTKEMGAGYWRENR